MTVCSELFLRFNVLKCLIGLSPRYLFYIFKSSPEIWRSNVSTGFQDSACDSGRQNLFSRSFKIWNAFTFSVKSADLSVI